MVAEVKEQECFMASQVVAEVESTVTEQTLQGLWLYVGHSIYGWRKNFDGVSDNLVVGLVKTASLNWMSKLYEVVSSLVKKI